MTERAEIQSAWASEAHAARVRFSKIGCVLAAILIPAGFALDTLEHLSEHLIEAVEMALVLHQKRARQIIEFIDAGPGDAHPVAAALRWSLGGSLGWGCSGGSRV